MVSVGERKSRYPNILKVEIRKLKTLKQWRMAHVRKRNISNS